MACDEYITITTLTDLVNWVEPRLGADGSRAVAQRMAEELAGYDDRPEWGADWSRWLRAVAQDGRFSAEREAAEREAAESGPVAENVYGETIRVGDRVGGGESDDHDHGEVIAIDGDQVTVRWNSGVTCTQGAALLTRGDDDECEICSAEGASE